MSSENRAASIKTVPASSKSMAYFAAQSLGEFVDASGHYGEVIGKRCAEIRLPSESQSFLATYPDLLYVVVLATPEDPDTVAVVPILSTIVKGCARLSMRLLSDEDDLTQFDALVDGVDLINELDELDLPQAYFFDEDWQLVAQWGPRPKATESYLDGWLAGNPEYERLAESDDDADLDAYAVLLERLTHEMRIWYNSGLNQACIREVCDLLRGLQAGRDES